MADNDELIEKKSLELAKLYVQSGKKAENVELFPIKNNGIPTDEVIVVAVYRVKKDGTAKKAATVPVSSQVNYCKTCGRPY